MLPFFKALPNFNEMIVVKCNFSIYYRKKNLKIYTKPGKNIDFYRSKNLKFR